MDFGRSGEDEADGRIDWAGNRRQASRCAMVSSKISRAVNGTITMRSRRKNWSISRRASPLAQQGGRISLDVPPAAGT